MAFFDLPDTGGANSERLFERSPAVVAAWQQLNGAIKEMVDLRLYEIATVAAATELRSSYCALAHGQVLLEKFGVAPGDPLDERDQAVQRFARKVVRDATSVTQGDVDELRQQGLNDDEIFAVILAAAARSFFSKALDAAGVQPDASFRDELPDEVREPLVVGRPIEG
jgi:alkylhydroperoxidase family enzyme